MSRIAALVSLIATWLVFAVEVWAAGVLRTVPRGFAIPIATQWWSAFNHYRGPLAFAILGTAIVAAVVFRTRAENTGAWLAVYNALLAVYATLSVGAGLLPFMPLG